MSIDRSVYLRRRAVLAGAGTALASSLAGCSGDGSDGTASPGNTGTATDGTTAETETTPTPTPTATPEEGQHELVERVVQEGHFTVNNAGSRSQRPFEHLYRSDETPLQLETDVGGTVVSGPHEDGVELLIDLTADDEFAGSGVYFGPFDLTSISEIVLGIEGDRTRLVIELDLNDDGDYTLWEETDQDRERFAGYGGDDRVISEYVSGGPIRADEPIFFNPPGGGKDPARGLSIEDLREYDAETVWIGPGIDHEPVEPPGTHQVVVTDFSVA